MKCKNENELPAWRLTRNNHTAGMLFSCTMRSTKCACVSSDCQKLAVQEELNGYKLSWVNLSQENMEDRVHGDQETQTASLANRDNYKLLGLLQDGPMSFAN